MSLLVWSLVLVGSFCGGLANALAGGGSFITIPLLIFAGLPAASAIGTNRVALVFMTATSTFRFHREKKLDVKKIALLSIPALIGAVLGAKLVLAIPEATLRTIIALLLFVNIPIIFSKDRIMSKVQSIISNPRYLEIGGILVLFFLGVYNGFFGAGVGFFLISTFLLFYRQELVNALASRSLVAFISSITAALVFISERAVDYSLLIPLTLGFMAGAWIGAGLAVKKGDKFVKIVLLIVIIISTLKLLVG
ncbi:sulfite exporter TauE/SafE family protein [Candidatus Altiarchaeota archaeon]